MIEHYFHPCICLLNRPIKPKIIPMKYLNDGRWLTDPLMFDDPSIEIFFTDSKDSNRNVWGNQIGLEGEVKNC